MENFTKTKVDLFNIDDVFGGWAKAYRDHFVKGGLYGKMSKKKL
jgi:sulfate/thiosulfate transport system substrate-binding protein